MDMNDKELIEFIKVLNKSNKFSLTQAEMIQLLTNPHDGDTVKTIARRCAKRKKAVKDRFSKASRTESNHHSKSFRQQLINKQTKAEKLFKVVLKSLNIDYVFQKVFRDPNQMRIVDFYVPKYNIVFEIDGGYHESDLQIKKDINRTQFLKYMGVKAVLRIKNEDVYDINNCIRNTRELLKKYK